MPIPIVRLPPQLQALRLWRDPLGALRGWADRHGDLFWLDLPAVGPVVVVGDPTPAHEVLRSDPDTSGTGVATGRVLPLHGPGCVLRLDDEAHRDRRRLLKPSFRLPNPAATREIVGEAARRTFALWRVGYRAPSLAHFKGLTFSVIAAMVLGDGDPSAITRLHRLVRGATGLPALAATWMWPLRPGRLHELALASMRRRQALLDEALAQIVLDRQRERGAHDNVLQAMLDAGLGNRAVRELHEELAALLIVGHETTAAALAWAVERLVHEPAVLAQLEASLGKGDSTYLDAFIYEVLRWRPPVVDTVRQLKVPSEVAGHPLDAGTLVMVSPYLVHRRLYESSDTFRPDRFIGRASPESREWIPFGGGSRRCLGAELAVTEMSVVLTELLRVFKLQPSSTPGERARLVGTVIVPAQGGMVTLSRVRS